MIGSRVRSAAAHAGSAALWVTAVLGVVSILLGLATVVAGVQPLIFRSSSMSPAIDAGALALAKTVPASEVEVDDIISVTNTSGVRVTHRVVEVEDDEGDQRSFTLKGDSNSSPDRDPYFASEVDRVFFDVPYLGYVANWMASPWAMFAAGVIAALLAAALWNRRSRPERSSAAGTAAAAVVTAGLVAAALIPVPRTEAFFSDPSTFTAGAINATEVTIFDLQTPECVEENNSVKLRFKLASSRFTTVFDRTAVGGPVSGGVRIRELDVAGPRDTPVETTFTRAQVVGSPAAVNGPYELVGRSKVRGAGSTWLSSQERRVGIRVESTGVRCGTTNPAPTLTFTGPVDGDLFFSEDDAEFRTRARCGQHAPCGTTSDANGIYSVEYKLQYQTSSTTQCWNPAASGFYRLSCGPWRTANTTPSVPTSTGAQVTWKVPLGIANSTTFNNAGLYTLSIRVTDNASPRAVTERVIQYRRL